MTGIRKFKIPSSMLSLPSSIETEIKSFERAFREVINRTIFEEEDALDIKQVASRERI